MPTFRAAAGPEFFEPEQLDTRVGYSSTFYLIRGCICRCIIDDDDLDVIERLSLRALEGTKDGCFSIKSRNQD